MTLDHYLHHRRSYEVLLWATFLLSQATAQSWVVIRDIGRTGYGAATWEPLVWEFSSVLSWAALIPVLVAFNRRYPLRLRTLSQHIPLHLAFTLVVSIAHVAGMVALRHLSYAFTAESYDFGHWPSEFVYEYIKDFRTYWALLAIIYLYNFILIRLQGEASLLDRPDEGDPVEPIEHPERLLVRKLGKEFLINVRDIEWIEASGNYVNLHVGQRIYPLRETMTALHDRLDPERFRRVHRSFSVNLDFVADIETLDSGDARIGLRTGAVVPCSRRYRGNLSV